MVTYVELEHVSDDDADYYTFPSFDAAVAFIRDNPFQRYVISSQPVGLPESEYTPCEVA